MEMIRLVSVCSIFELKCIVFFRGKFYIGNSNASLIIMNSTDWSFKSKQLKERGCIECLDIFPDGKIVIGFSSGMLSIYSEDLNLLYNDDHLKIKSFGRFSMEDYPITSICIFNNNIFISSNKNGFVKMWFFTAMTKLRNDVILFRCDPGDYVSCMIKLSNNTIAFGYNSGKIDLYIINLDPTIRPMHLGTLNGHKNFITSLKLIEENMLLSTGKDNIINKWDLTTYLCIKKSSEYRSKGFIINVVSVIPKYLYLSVSSDGILKLWNIKSDICLRTYIIHDNDIRQLFIGPDFSILLMHSFSIYRLNNLLLDELQKRMLLMLCKYFSILPRRNINISDCMTEIEKSNCMKEIKRREFVFNDFFKISNESIILQCLLNDYLTNIIISYLV
jgi:WD40 repeat protein